MGTDDESTDKQKQPPKRNTEPVFIRTDIQPSEVEKRSKYCKHGYVWGRCPEGCR
jgi:hypothetical protein